MQGSWFLKFILATWIIAVLGGLAGFWWKNTRPAVAETPVLKTEALNLDTQDETLVLFIHPRCDCTKASAHELSQLERKVRSAFNVRVVAYYPEHEAKSWADTDLLAELRALPRTEIIYDRGGKLSYSLGARSSGYTMLFDRKGQLQFRGGLTESRGHVGESQGGRSIAALIEGREPEARVTPHFGCSLFSSKELKQFN
jgi:hypothetical protein